MRERARPESSIQRLSAVFFASHCQSCDALAFAESDLDAEALFWHECEPGKLLSFEWLTRV